MKKIKVKLVRSVASCKQGHRDNVRGLGLKRINHSVEVEATPAIIGMVRKVNHLVAIESI